MCCSPGASDTFLIARLCASPRKQLQAVKHTPADSGGTSGLYKNIFTSGESWWEWDSLSFLCSLNVILPISAWPHFCLTPFLSSVGPSSCFYFTKKPKKQQPRNHYLSLFVFKFMDLLLGWGDGGSSFTLINEKPSAAQVLRGHGARLWLVETQAPAFVNAPVSCGSTYIYRLDLLVTE